MDEQAMFTLMVDLHRDGERQGPGSEEETLRALDLTRLDQEAALQVADIGCGTGASTLVLASRLPNAQVTAVDLFPEFLDVLSRRARKAGVSERVDPLEASMESLPFDSESLDLIWAEGAIYNMGFSEGIKTWKPFLRPGGVLAVSEITWLRPDPPETIRRHWNAEYPQIATASEKINILEDVGFDLLGYLVLPPNNWIDNYYEPTEKRMPAFLDRHDDRPEAAQIVAMEREEADLYRSYQEWYSYGFYVARKR
ncbi:SAM-dependent methyltransferase [Longibacter salinarum]|uniref:SAM-dependent methyltransferase n=1 Tax=Longibacter salinarum TaxID=1850348 RepID=A0A2A8CVH8_9BACT|nr:class I SAM-dependent methyltransferase [Longibacter salinarum]PEN12715.1 SAM-dependent methyltransferase [Longibacter salinarum]